jgi:hypothetical protein
MLIQLANDHTGHFTKAIDGVNTVDTQVADNDYALAGCGKTRLEDRFAGETACATMKDQQFASDGGAGIQPARRGFPQPARLGSPASRSATPSFCVATVSNGLFDPRWW